jgi:hypothetical protein
VDDLVSLPLWLKYGLGAAIAALGAWLANRLIGKAAWQQSINSGFNNLVVALQAEREALIADFKAERIELTTRLEELEKEYEAAKAEAHAERVQLRGEIRNLVQVIRSLENTLRAAGIPIPESPAPSAVVFQLMQGGFDDHQG